MSHLSNPLPPDEILRPHSSAEEATKLYLRTGDSDTCYT